MIYVKIEFIVQTPEYGKPEFKREVEKLLQDIDPTHTRLEDFDMYEVSNGSLATAETL